KRVAGDREVARALASAPPSLEKRAFLDRLAATASEDMSALSFALVIEHLVETSAAASEWARRLLSRAAEQATTIDDPEALRRLAIAARLAGSANACAAR